MSAEFTKKSLRAFLLVILLLVSYGFVSRGISQSGFATISTGGTIQYIGMGRVILSFEAFDLESAGELQILVNDIAVASIPKVNTPEWDEVWVPTPFVLDITAACKPTDNMIRFHNPLTAGYSRVRNVTVTNNDQEIFFELAEATIVAGGRDAFYGPFEASLPPEWYGIGEDYLLWAWEKGLDYVEEWSKLLDDQNHFAKHQFNTIRLMFHFPGFSPHPLGWHENSELDYSKMDTVIGLLDARGIKAILDDHSYVKFGSQEWIDRWVQTATYYRDDYRIAAFELRNEASEWSYEQGLWWDGTYCQSRSRPDWAAQVARAFAACTDAIRAVDPDRTVIWADPLYYDFYIPPDAIRTSVVTAFHGWCSGTTVEEGVAEAFEEEQRMANWMRNYGRVWMGEFGPAPREPWDVQKASTIYMINWCVDNNVGFNLYLYSRPDWNGLDGMDEILAESKYDGLW